LLLAIAPKLVIIKLQSKQHRCFYGTFYGDRRIWRHMTVGEGYCVLVNLVDRQCLVVGGGSVAHRKADALCRCGANVHIAAPEISNSLAAKPNITIHKQQYDRHLLQDKTLVFACTDDKQLNHRIAQDCRQEAVLCNIVDEPSAGDFIVPAVFRRGPIQVAVGTSGASPYLAGRIRDLIGGWLDHTYESFAKILAEMRITVIDSVTQIDRRKAIFQKLAGKESFERFKHGGENSWLKWVDITTEGQLHLTKLAEKEHQQPENPTTSKK